jgi:hypothetical protein
LSRQEKKIASYSAVPPLAAVADRFGDGDLIVGQIGHQLREVSSDDGFSAGHDRGWLVAAS